MVYKLQVSAPPEAEHWVWPSQKPLRAHFECIFKLGHSNEWDLALSLFFWTKIPPFFVLFLLPRLSASSHRLARVSPYYITTRTFHSEIWVRIGITKQVLIDHDWYAYILVRCRSPLASAMASEPRFVLLFKFLNWSSFSNLSARVRLTQVVFLGGTQFYAERG